MAVGVAVGLGVAVGMIGVGLLVGGGVGVAGGAAVLPGVGLAVGDADKAGASSWAMTSVGVVTPLPQPPNSKTSIAQINAQNRCHTFLIIETILWSMPLPAKSRAPITGDGLRITALG